ncbi:MAG: hypothetical protein MUF52_14445 [Syntrophobacteraceae bacterium]|jgi:hypothetical protein|nr:hypothetical protein [Syntrophobacteraceae bacterium]
MSRKISGMPHPFHAEGIWILGAGRFGRIAAERLTRRFTDMDFLVIDERPDRLDALAEDLGVKTFTAAAIPFMSRQDLPDGLWIVPAIPVHAAFQWLLSGSGLASRAAHAPVPESVDSQVPNPMRVADGTVYASHATFLCPDACSEPEERCTHTGEPRPGNLFDDLSRISVPGFQVAVLRSWQLAPGVGGYSMAQLRQLERDVLRQPGGHIVATSCRCHGVLNALHWS